MIDPKKYLEEERIYHIDMLNALLDEKTEVLYSEEDGVMLKMGGHGPLAISAKTEEAMAKMANLVSPEHFGGVVRPFKFMPILFERAGKLDMMPCHQICYTSGKLFEEPKIEGIEFHDLTEEDIPFVMQEYEDDERYIKNRVKAGMIGAFNEKGECVGFIGTHGEGSIGLLKVIPEYRRKGIANALEARMMNRKIKTGETPFAHVVVGNYKSIALQNKMGMEIADKIVTWVWPYED